MSEQVQSADQIQDDDDLVNPHNQRAWKDLVNPHNQRAWKDLEGAIIPKTTGVGSPTLTVFTGNVRNFAFAAGVAIES